MKKFLSTILVLCMTLNLFIGVMPAFAEDETGILTVADFSNIETVKEAVAKDGNGNFSASIAETYNDAPVSLKWSVPSDRVATPGFKIENTDLSKYTHFRMRFYCTTPDEKFVVFASSKGEPDISVPHYYRVITATGNGWQEVSVPVTYFGSKSVDIDGVSTAPSWDNIGGVCLYTDFYSGAAATDTIGGHNIYIDKIWFENSDKTYASGTTDLKPGDISVFDVTSVADQNATDAGKFQLETVNAREGGNEAYIIRKINALTKETTTYNPSGTVDVSSMKYLNMWVYSPKATNGAFIVRTHSSSSDYKGYFREDKSIAERMLLDWEGWNLISIDLSDSWSGGSGGTYDPTKFDFVQIITNYAGEAVNGGATAQWHTDAYYGIDKIWFSSEKPTVTRNIPAEGTSWTLPSGNEMIYEFNSSTAMTTASNGGNNGHATANVLNTNIYDVSNRNAFSQTNKKDFVALVAAFNKVSAIQTKTVGKDYLHMWMYNPGIKYTDTNKTDVSDICLLIESEYGTTLQHETIALDWEGWKIVTVPLNETVKENGFGCLRLAGNYQTNKGCTYTGCTAVAYSDVYLARYFDIDNIWVSNSTISAPVMTGMTHNGATYTFTFNNEIAATMTDKVTAYNKCTPMDDATVEINGNTVTVTFTSAPTEDDTYQIKFDKDMRDAYGAKLGNESIVIEDISSDTLTVDNTNLTIKGFEGMTLAEVREALDLSDGMSVSFSENNETLTAQKGMKMNVTMSGLEYSAQYTLDVPLYEVTGVKYYMDNVEVESFSAGSLKAEISAVCYNKKKEVPALMIVSQYTQNGFGEDEIVKVEADEVSVTGSGKTVSVTLDVERTEDTTVQVYLWDIPNLRPMANYTLNPTE